LQVLFEKYNKIICYVKDEGTHLSTMINVHKQIVYYEKLMILPPFEGVCFGHAHLQFANMSFLMRRYVGS